MVDYSIDDDKWNDKKKRVIDWFNDYPEHDNLLPIVEGLFSIGDGQPQLRKKHWAGVCSCFIHLPGVSPISSRQSLPLDIEKAMNAYISGLEHDYADFYDSVPLGLTVRPHGKTGNTHYENAEDYAYTMARSARVFLMKAYRERESDTATYRWDGSFKNDTPEVTIQED